MHKKSLLLKDKTCGKNICWKNIFFSAEMYIYDKKTLLRYLSEKIQ